MKEVATIIRLSYVSYLGTTSQQQVNLLDVKNELVRKRRLVLQDVALPKIS